MPTENQKYSVGVFVIVEREEKLLFVRAHRYKGFSLPGGGAEILSSGATENVDAAGRRETLEEANAVVKLGRLVGIFSLQKSAGIVIVFEGALIEERPFQSTEEIAEKQWIPISHFTEPPRENGIPILPAQRGFVMHYLAHREDGSFPIYGPPIPAVHVPESVS